MIIQLVIGIVLAYMGFYGHAQLSPALFVEGMIIANHAVLTRLKHRSLEHL